MRDYRGVCYSIFQGSRTTKALHTALAATELRKRVLYAIVSFFLFRLSCSVFLPGSLSSRTWVHVRDGVRT